MRTRTPRLMPLLLFGMVLLTAARAAALGRESPNLSVGPSLSYVDGPGAASGWGYGIDAAYVAEARPLGTFLWASAGFRALDGKRDSYTLASAEAGAWLGANIGVGYTHTLGGGTVGRRHLHAFLGVPIPLFGVSRPRVPGFFIEPFARAMTGFGGDRAPLMEYGVLVKFTTLKYGCWSPSYD